MRCGLRRSRPVIADAERQGRSALLPAPEADAFGAADETAPRNPEEETLVALGRDPRSPEDRHPRQLLRPRRPFAARHPTGRPHAGGAGAGHHPAHGVRGAHAVAGFSELPLRQRLQSLGCRRPGRHARRSAFLLPILNKLSEGGHPEDAINCVIMSPTRELAQQIDQQMEGFSLFYACFKCVAYGGNDGILLEQQKKGLMLGADVVIATPGRLIAHLSLGYVDLSRVSYFILDEADRMLDMGFYEDIMQIVKYFAKRTPDDYVFRYHAS